jgi:glyoxylase-like metal-dependent hydrolase (beta-lactamase superfamily II)
MPGVEIVGGKNDGAAACTKEVGHGDVVTVGGVKVDVLYTPCHTQGHVCFYIKNEKEGEAGVVFTGDTLFVGGTSRSFAINSTLAIDARTRDAPNTALRIFLLILCTYDRVRQLQQWHAPADDAGTACPTPTFPILHHPLSSSSIRPPPPESLHRTTGLAVHPGCAA